MLKMLVFSGEISASLGMSVSDLWRGMASRKSHVSELKNWMLRQPDQKNKGCLSIQFLLREFCNLRLVDLNNYLKYV